MEYPLLHEQVIYEQVVSEQVVSEQRGWKYYTTPKVWLPRIWNGASSVLGLVGALGGRWQWNAGDLILEVAGGWLIDLLSRAGWASAITLGEVVLYADRRLIPVLHDHEMVHVRQGRLWGPFFLPAYVLESAFQWLRTGDGYRSNRFEIAAYQADRR